MTDDVPLKRCTKCGRQYPATEQYFHKRSELKGDCKLQAQCKRCKNRASQERWRRQMQSASKLVANDLGKPDMSEEAVERRAWSRAHVRTDDSGRWKNYWED